MSELESVATKRPSRAAPVQAKERIEFVDILRGFALLGVLLMNMYGLSGQMAGYTNPLPLPIVDRAVVILVRFLVEAKFYSMFSFLFGWGMAMQMMRAEAKGAKFLPVFLRRLFILLIIGVLHAILIWDGDILTTYALLGFLLLLFRKRSGKALLVTAVLVLLLSIVLTVPGEAMDTVREWYENLTDFLRSSTYSESLYATGTYKEVTRFRIQGVLAGHSRFMYYFGNIFGMFLLGLYVGKRRIFREIGQHLPALRKVVWVFLVIGLVFNAIFISTILWPQRVPAEYHRLVRVGGRTIGAPALMLFYVSAIILLIQREDWYRRLSPLANLGRSALSNYLLQSVVCTLIFYNYGLGLYGEIGPPFALILTLAIYWAQVRLSGWWFERFQFGPMEWVWRTLTYGRRQPLRREAAYDDRLSTLWRRMRQIAARVDPRIALAGTWVVLLLWAAALVAWYVRLEEPPNIQYPISNIQAQATATPIRAQADSQPEGQPQVVATPVVQPVAYNPGSIAASGDLLALASTFSAESALAQIETLTGPPYLGRYTGSPEGWAAGDYIAEQFASYGLQPAGDDGSFFQSFPVFYTALAEVPILVVEGPDGTVYDRYTLNKDFIAFVRWYSGSGRANGGVVWANDCTHDDFKPIDVVDKVALCRSDSVPLMDAERNALEHGAAGLMLLITDPEQRPPDFGITYREIWIPEPIPVFRVYPSVAEDLLLGSGKSVEDLSTSFAPFPLSTQARMEVTTTGPEACPSQGCQGRNVLGVLPGRDPKYADEIIIIGGHYDHLGQTPDGTVWPGANDDASGVAVMLEIARSWHEQGYVPRRTVLFAAWDAEEVGLVGSTYYVEHPRYPLENAVAKIQLDMVGAGGDTLEIDGGGGLAEKLRSVAEALGIETESTQSGGSDHVPFQRASIPAALLIWSFLGETEPQWHRPGDVPATIELDKLDAVGKIAEITTLGFTEGEPAIGELLARRATAVEQGDLPAFLATSLPDQEAADRFWFDDVQAFDAPRFEMQSTNVRLLGRTATSTVRMTLEYPVAGERELEAKTFSLDTKFAHTEDGWRWAGPNLVWADQEPGFALAYPPGEEKGLWQLGQLAAERYAEIAELLGLPTESDAALMLFPRAQSLRVSTALSVSPGQDVWVSPGVVKLVYSEGISTGLQLADALAQLLLVEAGVTESAAPWLWQGLPLVLRAVGQESPDRALVEIHTEYLANLRKALDDDDEEEAVALNDATAWAAVDYLRQRVGWQGLGRFITAFGQACRAGLCDSADGMDLALSDTVQMDSSAFETAWQTHWRDELTTAQANLDVVLTARTGAVLARDEAAFLNTVDPQVPNLMSEERHWLAGSTSLTSFSSTGEPLALLEDGSILAEVTLEYRLAGSASNFQPPTSNFQVLFTPSGEGYRWAGVPFEVRQSDRGSVLYSEGQAGQAWALLNEAETIYAQLAAELGVEQPDPLTIKLYESDDVFRASVFPSFPLVDWAPAWTGEGESVKLLWQRGAALADYRPTLAVQLARRLLYQLGVDAEWLIKGVSIYLSRNFDGGATERTATENLYPLLRAAQKGTLRGLGAIPPDYRLSRDELGLANAQAWDAVRYLVYTHGWETLIDLLHSQEGLGAALQNTIGQTLPEFEAVWLESVAHGHTLPEWIEIAWAFDPEMANRHVEYLASPPLAGRQAGSPGAEAAAAYVADRFAEYGLVPVGDEATFLQHFPISYTTLLSTPRLEIMDEGGPNSEAFVYREDFLMPANETGSGGTAADELIWIRDGDYQGMELDGKIALRSPISSVGTEVARAVEHGASGLILVGEKGSKRRLLAKSPLPLEFSPENTIPVLELTRDGYSKLLERSQAVASHTQDSISNSPPALPLGLEALIEIPLRTPETVETVNVLGLLPGSDPVLGQEVIVLGAHYDHVGDDPGRRYAGANDNASGVRVLLQMARLWHETGYRPKRSVLFAAWGAQEPGELGSSYYVDNPVLPLDKTVAMLQLDAVGGGGGYYLEARGEWEQDGLLLFSMMATEDLIDGRLAIRGQSGESDQAPFHEAGLPILLVAWRGASEDNWPVEIADEVDPYRLGVTGRMVTLALMSIAR